MLTRTDLPSLCRVALIALAASLPAACVTPPPPAPPANPFLGAWSSGENNQIAFRDTTVVQVPAGGQSTTLGPEACGGKFRFTYTRRSRDALLAEINRQPDVRNRLAGMLKQPEYSVADLVCEDGSSTYVLLDDRNAVAIYRDEDIATVQPLARF